MFGKKKMTVDEIHKAYEFLADDEKMAFKQSLSDRTDESVGEEEMASGVEDSQTVENAEDSIGTEQVNNSEEVIEEGQLIEEPEISENEGESESVGNEGEPESVISESPSEEVPEEILEEESASIQAKEDEVAGALGVRIDALENEISSLKQLLIDKDENGGEFGLSPKPSMGKGEVTDDDRIMNNYYKKNPRAYK